jgi:hypothetical protein
LARFHLSGYNLAQSNKIKFNPSGGLFGRDDFMNSALSKLGIVGELLQYLWSNKKWWLIPMVLVLILFGMLLVFASASGVAPFIYTIF